MTTSPAGRKLIESFEGYRAEAYLPTPNDVPTIGYGHTHEVKMGDTCTQEQADEFLAEDLRAAELAIETLVTVPLDQNQFDALVSFQFNTGWLGHPGCSLVRALNAGNYALADADFSLYDEASGRVLTGLLRRRKAEAALFNTPVEVTT